MNANSILLFVGAVLLLAGLAGGLTKLYRHLRDESLKHRLIKAWPTLNQEEKDEIIAMFNNSLAKKSSAQ